MNRLLFAINGPNFHRIASCSIAAASSIAEFNDPTSMIFTCSTVFFPGLDRCAHTRHPAFPREAIACFFPSSSLESPPLVLYTSKIERGGFPRKFLVVLRLLPSDCLKRTTAAASVLPSSRVFVRTLLNESQTTTPLRGF